MLSALSSERVEFLLVGGHAVMAHTEPRYTKDIDIWVRPTKANALRVMRALRKFGAPLFDLSVDDLTRPNRGFIIGVEPVRIDILTSIPGVRFEAAWKRRFEMKYGKVRVGVLSAADLIRNKRLVGRPLDLADVSDLQAALKERKRQRRR